jgi:tetratricopeptide (TPR) repeat protein
VQPTQPNASPPPPWVRDPWAWASALAVLPLAWRMLGAPLGEPVAEDFDFLHRALLEGMGTLLDGGGSLAFWRPIPHQLYYGALGGLLLANPTAVGVLHLALLAVASLLVYRALRPTWSGPLAAAAASFPLLAESTRTIAGWPTQFVDLGLHLFVALALHEASRRRLWTALAALLGALLCKEVAVAAAALLPLLPVGPRGRAERARWAAGCAAVAIAWAALYAWVRAHAGLSLPHGLEHDPQVLATPLVARLAWAFDGSLRSATSLALVPGRWDALLLGGGAGLVALALVAGIGWRAARARLARTWPWIAWGLAWFALATASLAAIFPLWQPNRAEFGSVGLGVALAAALGAAHPALVAALVTLRLAALTLAPGAATEVRLVPPETGAFMDFAHLTRLQRFMLETRRALHERHATLPHGAIVVQQNLPYALEYALGGDRALQVWYRDPTLRWERFEAFRADRSMEVETIVQFQPDERRAIALVDPGAARAQVDAYDALVAGRWMEAIAILDRADSLQRDPAARVFLASNAARRAFCLGVLGRVADAEAEARRGLALRRTETNARFVLAMSLAEQRRYDEADAQLDTLLAIAPGDSGAIDLRARIAAGRPR